MLAAMLPHPIEPKAVRSELEDYNYHDNDNDRYGYDTFTTPTKARPLVRSMTKVQWQWLLAVHSVSKILFDHVLLCG